MTVTLCFYAQFVASKAGANGLTVTWDVERITRADGTRSALQTGAATNISVGRRGLYGYYQTGCDLDLYDYIATAITSDTTVDQKEIPALWTYWIAEIGDAAVASVSGNVGGNVMGSVASVTNPVTLTGAYDLAKTAATQASVTALPTAAAIADAVWDEATADHQTAGTTGKALSDAGASGDPWAAPVRTLTTPANGTGGSADAGRFVVYRGTSWSIPITGLGSLADRVKLYVTVKNAYGEDDAGAVVQWEESAGLVRFNGAAATASQGSLTVTDANAGNITLTLKPAMSKDAAPKGYKLDVKKITAGGADVVGTGILDVRPVVTRAVS